MKKIFIFTVTLLILSTAISQAEMSGTRPQYDRRDPSRFAKGKLIISFSENFYYSPSFNVQVLANKEGAKTGSSSLDKIFAKWRVYNIRKLHQMDNSPIRNNPIAEKNREQIAQIQKEMDRIYVIEFSPSTNVFDVLDDLKKDPNLEKVGADGLLKQMDVQPRLKQRFQ